ARDVGISAGIHGNAVTLVRTRAPDKRGINELSSRWIQLEDVGIRGSAFVFGLSCRLDWNVRGARCARNVNAADRIDCDSVSDFRPRPAKECRVNKYWIDNERLRFVVIAEFETDVASTDHILGVDDFLMPIDFLIHMRLSLDDGLGIRFQNEVAGGVQRYATHTGKADSDSVRTRSRLDDEIVLELPPIAVILDINAGIDL